VIAGRRARGLVATTPIARVGAAEALALVAARLRAGAEPEDAWRGVELVTSSGAATVRAARELARELGAPLAELLDEVGVGVTDDESAEAEREAALAGPAATGRLLGWLPVAGLLLALVLGADVLAVASDAGVGTASTAAGLVLVLVGQAWTRALVRTARKAVP